MISAAHHTMMGPEAGIKPPYDWSYSAVMDKRDAIAATAVRRTPTVTDLVGVDSSTLNMASICTGSSRFLVLTDLPGKIGIVCRFNDAASLAEYCIFDPYTGAFTRTGTTMQVSSSNAAAAMAMGLDGRVCVVTRYDGGVYSFKQDGSDPVKHGNCEAFPSGRNVRLFQIPEGGFISFGEESTTRHLYKIDASYNVSLQLTWAQKNYYFYSAIAMPDYWVFHQPQGVIMRMARDLSSSTVVSSLTAASYECIQRATAAPLTRGEVFFGMCGRSSGGKLLVGYRSSTNTAIYSNSITSSSQIDKPDGGSRFCMLPTGEAFGHIRYNATANPPNMRKNDWYVYDYGTDTFSFLGFEHDGTTDVGFNEIILPTGKCLAYRNTSVGSVWTFKEFDFGFSKKQCPVDILNSPFGYNYHW